MKGRRTVAAGALVLSACLAALPAEAGEISRKVHRGETLARICREVYGDKDLYRVVALYNGKRNPGAVKEGEILRLPYSETVVLGPGESLSLLARKLWGDPSLYTVIAWANGIRNPSRVAAGTRVVVPVLIPYRLGSGESLSSVAESFYQNPRQFAPIAAASAVEDPAKVKAGASLRIPMVLTRARDRTAAAGPTAGTASKTPTAGRRTEDGGRRLLARAERAYRTGKYEEALALGVRAASSLSGTERARALRLTALMRYAQGNLDEALADLRTAVRLDPGYSPDPAYYNPEFVRLYERAR